MKVLVISDTHRNISNVERVLELVMPRGVKTVLHCGDNIDDARRLQKLYPQLTIHAVYGNCDGLGYGEDYTKVVEVGGVDIFMTHGNRYNVKWDDYETLMIDAMAHDAQAAVCGHSHCAHLEKNEDFIMLNPGSMSEPRDGYGPSYAILDIEEGKIKDVAIMQITENHCISRHPSGEHKL